MDKIVFPIFYSFLKSSNKYLFIYNLFFNHFNNKSQMLPSLCLFSNRISELIHSFIPLFITKCPHISALCLFNKTIQQIKHNILNSFGNMIILKSSLALQTFYPNQRAVIQKCCFVYLQFLVQLHCYFDCFCLHLIKFMVAHTSLQIEIEELRN